MLKLCKKPIFWALVAVAICFCLVLTWLVTQFLFGSERFRSVQAQYYAHAIGRALETDGEPLQVDVFSSCSLDSGYTAVAFVADGSRWNSDLGAALFGSGEEEGQLLDLAYCPDGVLENRGTQILRLTLPDGTAYDAVISTDSDLRSMERIEYAGTQTVLPVENCPFFALFVCSTTDVRTDYFFYNADGQTLSNETNDMQWMTGTAYVLAHCLYSAWDGDVHSEDLVLLGDSSITLLSGISNRVLDAVNDVSWCGQRLTDTQWQAMFADAQDGRRIGLPPYAQRLMLEAGPYRLFYMDTRIWFAFTDENGQIVCLYELVRQPSM